MPSNQTPHLSRHFSLLQMSLLPSTSEVIDTLNSGFSFNQCVYVCVRAVDYQFTGQPVLIGGTMGTCSYVLTGTQKGFEETFGR
jgi:hypothetical protein